MSPVPGIGSDVVRRGGLAVRVDALSAQLEARPGVEGLCVPRDLLEGLIDATRRFLVVCEGIRRLEGEDGRDG